MTSSRSPVRWTIALAGLLLFTPPAFADNQDAPANGLSGGDLYERLRAGYAIDIDAHSDKRTVNQHLDWFRRNQEYLDRVFKRSERYLFYIATEIAQRELPLELALLPVVESAFDPFAYSPGRAAGLWQLIPVTATRFGVRQSWWYDGRRDVLDATDAALDYLEKLNKRFDGDWLKAVAAYNSGEGRVSGAIRANVRKGKQTDFWSLRLPPETRSYVPRLLALAMIVRDPEAFGLSLPALSDVPYFAVVPVNGQIDLALASNLAGVTIDELYRLNPGLNRWATDPEGPHRLLVPLLAEQDFIDALAVTSPEDRVTWRRHRVVAGDSLGSIARKYGATVRLLQSANNLDGTNIRAGADLLVPSARVKSTDYRLSANQRAAMRLDSPGSLTHVVTEGESLWSIANRYDVGVRELGRWNDIAPRDLLRVGQKLAIRGRKQAAGPGEHPAGTRSITYVVRRGDSLSAISAKFRVSLSDLTSWNRDRLGKYLKPGQRLVLFVDVTEQSSG